MDPRLKLDALLRETMAGIDSLGDRFYYQPPDGAKLKYPCIVYKLYDVPTIHADNKPYHNDRVFQVTIMDRDPESVIRERMINLPKCRFERFFVSDNVNHYVFRIYI